MTNFLTQAGLIELQEELKNIEEVKIPEILQAINEALSAGDLSENSALDASRFEYDRLLAHKQYIEDVLADYQIIEETTVANSKTVQIGNTVKVGYLNEFRVFELKLTGVSESNILENKISNESPLAQAILGKRVGSETSFKVKNKKYKVKVIEIKS